MSMEDKLRETMSDVEKISEWLKPYEPTQVTRIDNREALNHALSLVHAYVKACKAGDFHSELRHPLQRVVWGALLTCVGTPEEPTHD